MIGDMIAKIREDKRVSKTILAQSTNINVGHLTHIEKGERNPSHKALKSICNSLEVPYQPLMYTYDRKLTEEQKGYNIIEHIKYDTIPMVDNISGFIKCPKEYNSASAVLRVNDDSMYPRFIAGSYVYVEFNAPLNNKDFGLFEYKGRYIIRKFIVRMNDLVLRAEQDNIEDIVLTENDEFYIIAKVLGKVEQQN